MLVGQSPFVKLGEVDDIALLRRIVKGPAPDYPRHLVTDIARDLIGGLLVRVPMKRLGCTIGGTKLIRQHKWFEPIDFGQLLRKNIKAPWVPAGDRNRAAR